MAKQELNLSQKTQTRQLLQGRLAAVKWLSLSEPEVAREFKDLESDTIFRELIYGEGGRSPVIRRKRWPASRLHSGFYEFKEELSAGSGSAGVHDIVEKHKGLVKLIKKIGQEAFERYFLYGEEGKPLSEICEELGISELDGRRILDLVLEVDVRGEFFRSPGASQAAGLAYRCIARIENDPREEDAIYFQFLSPHWARGKYEVLYDRLESWKKERELSAVDRRRLRGLLKRVEFLNMRQDTLFQILSRSTTVQSDYLKSRKEFRRRPLSLRELARRLSVAPSTVSRAVSTRSVVLPWGEEVPLKNLLTGRRSVVMSIMTHWAESGEIGPKTTDEQLMRRLADETGISVSRRTVNECRRKLPSK